MGSKAGRTKNFLNRFSENARTIRDPIWSYIELPPFALKLVDTEDFQRLRHISQLGHVSLVYPGARHSRFEHCIGVFHLARLFLERLMAAPAPPDININDAKVFLAAALLHDIGHYPFSHILEEMGFFFVDHEERARLIIEDKSGEIYQALKKDWGISPSRVADVIDYKNPTREISERDLRLARILSGTLDPDKIDYLLRDSRYCGVPFGESVNKDRLLSSIIYNPENERLAITSKGISSIESLIFTNYLMYRNVYWHHGARAAAVMFKRIVQEIISHPDSVLTPEDFQRINEHDLMNLIHQQIKDYNLKHIEKMFDDLEKRRLYKRARMIYPHERRGKLSHYFHYLYRHPARRREKEIELCKEFGAQLDINLYGHEILVDIPKFGKNLEIDLTVDLGRDAPPDRPNPLCFDDPEVSRLKEYLIDNFETHAKVFRVFCINNDNLRNALNRKVLKHLSMGKPSESD